jgi:hypothetical protein
VDRRPWTSGTLAPRDRDAAGRGSHRRRCCPGRTGRPNRPHAPARPGRPWPRCPPAANRSAEAPCPPGYRTVDSRCLVAGRDALRGAWATNPRARRRCNFLALPRHS